MIRAACIALVLGMIVSYGFSVTRPKFTALFHILFLSPCFFFHSLWPLNIHQVPISFVTINSILAFGSWILTGYCFPGRFKRTTDHIDILLYAFAILSLAALATQPNESNPYQNTVATILFGALEPVLIYYLLRQWLNVYGFRYLLLKCIILSFGLSVLFGWINLLLNPDSNQFVSLYRQVFCAFGSANLLGLCLVAVFPLVFILGELKTKENLLWFGLSCVIFFFLSIRSLSRSTIAIILVQIIVLLALYWRNMRIRLPIFGALAVSCVYIVWNNDVVTILLERFNESGIVSYFGKNFTGISDSDTFRIMVREMAWDAIKERPLGGYAAHSDFDPETYFLDIPLQIGWLPGLLWFFLFVALFVSSIARLKSPPFACSCAGILIYGITTGACLAKINISGGGIMINQVPTIMLIYVVAIIMFDMELAQRARAWRQPRRDAAAVHLRRRTLFRSASN